MKRLILYANNINSGGGEVLLQNLLNSVPDSLEVIAFIDSRMMVLNVREKKNVTIKIVKPTLIHRLISEIYLSQLVNCYDHVLSFGNLPPIFKLKCYVNLYIHNRYIVDNFFPISNLSLKIQARIIFERIWLLLFKKNVDRFIVQTISMKLIAMKKIGTNIIVLPFVPNNLTNLKGQSLQITSKKDFEFIYIASGEAHKNHRLLIQAWIILSKSGCYPKLAITVSKEKFKKLYTWIDDLVKRYKLNIVNLGELNHSQVLQVYKSSEALIYPSLFESFGLPLIEAKLLGLKVLSSELDYVRDIITPDITFDPKSPISISRAVKRYFETSESFVEIISPNDFLTRVLI